MARKDAFTWLRGFEAISSYAKENGYKVNFCSHCGSPVPNDFRDYSLLSVPVGSIVDAPRLKVAVQLYLGSKAEWDKQTPESAQFDEMPSLREMLTLLGVHGQP